MIGVIVPVIATVVVIADGAAEDALKKEMSRLEGE